MDEQEEQVMGAEKWTVLGASLLIVAFVVAVVWRAVTLLAPLTAVLDGAAR